MFNLEGKKALVTGASRGIGKSIALTLEKMGAEVIGTATTSDGVESIARESKISGKVLNVTDPESIENLIHDIGGVDILVNNAGITRDGLLLRMKDADWHAVIETNLTSIYRLSKACLKYMLKARWGRIISISSLSAIIGTPGQVNYAAAKAGIIGLTKSLASEVAIRGITVNAVAPGFIETDMTRALTDEQAAWMMNRIPMARMGTSEEIAAAVGFLASSEAAYITGETIQVNGGMYMQ